MDVVGDVDGDGVGNVVGGVVKVGGGDVGDGAGDAGEGVVGDGVGDVGDVDVIRNSYPLVMAIHSEWLRNNPKYKSKLCRTPWP